MSSNALWQKKKDGCDFLTYPDEQGYLTVLRNRNIACSFYEEGRTVIMPFLLLQRHIFGKILGALEESN